VDRELERISGHVSRDDATRRTTVHPEPCSVRFRFDSLESLPFQIGHQFFREKAQDRSDLQHQPRIAAEAGECAYFLLFSSLLIARLVIGPCICICNCSTREAEKAARTSAYGFNLLI